MQGIEQIYRIHEKQSKTRKTHNKQRKWKIIMKNIMQLLTNKYSKVEEGKRHRYERFSNTNYHPQNITNTLENVEHEDNTHRA